MKLIKERNKDQYTGWPKKNATLWHYHWDSATKLCNECLGFIYVVFLFKVRAIMLLSTQCDAVR